ncbi:MAG: T9SS type A sorting domain-containing protein [Bacteroidales bacterium]|nr:T9SS type A sorting domain-containing protein [Bacteroidales bacterium]
MLSKFSSWVNACGEKEWCRIFHLAGPTTNYDFGVNIYPAPDDDGYIALVMQWGDEFVPGVFKGIWLFKLDSLGNSVWIKNVFDEVHPDAWNEIPNKMFIANGGTLIITGTVIYNDFGLPYGWDKPFIFAADPDGTEKWWAIMGQDETHFGLGNYSIGDIHGNIYTTGWYEDYDDGSSHYFPGLHKTDKYGNKIYSKYIIDSTEQANSFCINLMNDTLIDVGGVWNYPGEEDYCCIARTDTNGYLIHEKQVWQSIFGLAQSIKTFDNKELFVGPFKENGFTKIFLHKFNSDLEYDTIYTQSFDYDYMCDDLPIVSDTLGIDDCDIWTSLPGEIEYRLAQYLVVYPNPAKDKITVRLPRATAEERSWGPFTSRHFNHQYYKNSVLCIYDIFGRQVKEISLTNQQENELKIDVSALTSGIYLINLYENEKKMASGKFIIN